MPLGQRAYAKIDYCPEQIEELYPSETRFVEIVNFNLEKITKKSKYKFNQDKNRYTSSCLGWKEFSI